MLENVAMVYITKMSQPVTGKAKKAQSALGRALLYQGLLDLLGEDWTQQRIERQAGGKPYFPEHEDIQFSISHSQQYIVCAIASQPIGIDIQYHKTTKVERVARRVLSPQEQQHFSQAEEKQATFFRYWVEKESILKWTGEGLRRDLRSLTHQGTVQHLDVAPDYSCAICAAQPLEIKRKEIVNLET